MLLRVAVLVVLASVGADAHRGRRGWGRGSSGCGSGSTFTYNGLTYRIVGSQVYQVSGNTIVGTPVGTVTQNIFGNTATATINGVTGTITNGQFIPTGGVVNPIVNPITSNGLFTGPDGQQYRVVGSQVTNIAGSIVGNFIGTYPNGQVQFTAGTLANQRGTLTNGVYSNIGGLPIVNNQGTFLGPDNQQYRVVGTQVVSPTGASVGTFSGVFPNGQVAFTNGLGSGTVTNGVFTRTNIPITQNQATITNAPFNGYRIVGTQVLAPNGQVAGTFSGTVINGQANGIANINGLQYTAQGTTLTQFNNNPGIVGTVPNNPAGFVNFPNNPPTNTAVGGPLLVRGPAGEAMLGNNPTFMSSLRFASQVDGLAHAHEAIKAPVQPSPNAWNQNQNDNLNLWLRGRK